jgi:hypothetical protein
MTDVEDPESVVPESVVPESVFPESIVPESTGHEPQSRGHVEHVSP